MTREQRHEDMNQFIYLLQRLESALLSEDGKEAVRSRVEVMKHVAYHILGKDYKVLEELIENPELMVDNPENEVEA
ncbi:MAG TPA: hypothetical protein DHN29_09280 [Cytophagales bacterium]|jgi:hypothetical protein|nr:hypothetical protein [Cytophagales bacterium]|tara:strand:+ start:430 stop:657 length:228 start_codon:yes stop_codon:yes gene_type:complete